MTAYTSQRRAFGNPRDMTPGSVVRLGDGRLYRVLTPRILESCRNGEWVFDAEMYGYEPVIAEFIGNQADPSVRALMEEEKKC
jgi:hypothetical protein